MAGVVISVVGVSVCYSCQRLMCVVLVMCVVDVEVGGVCDAVFDVVVVFSCVLCVLMPCSLLSFLLVLVLMMCMLVVCVFEVVPVIVDDRWCCYCCYA